MKSTSRSGPHWSKKSSTWSTRAIDVLVHVLGDRIGDGLLKYPVIRAFKDLLPKSRITWITARRPSIFKGRLAGLAGDLFDVIFEQTGYGSSWTDKPESGFAGPFDVVLSTESRIRETLVLKRLKSRRFVSPALGFVFSNSGRVEDFKDLPVYSRFRKLMELVAGQSLDVRWSIEPPGTLVAKALEALPPNDDYAGLCPGAGGASKRWPIDRYLELATRLASEGLRPVFFLGPEEHDMVDRIHRHAPQALFPEVGQFADLARDPRFTIALAARMAFSISNDSGGGHLIAAGGRPLLTLYGHTSADKFKSPFCDHRALVARNIGRADIADVTVADAMKCLRQEFMLASA